MGSQRKTLEMVRTLLLFLFCVSFKLYNSEKSTQDYFSPHYDARFTIHIANRAENCFYMENLKDGYVINIHYLVISTKNGNQLDISMRMKDPLRQLITFQARKREGEFTNYKVAQDGDYEICFNNKYSMYESKKIMWEVSVVGDEENNWNKILNHHINRTLEKLESETQDVLAAITKVRYALARARHQQYWIKSKNMRDGERMITLQGMVNTWSLTYGVLICSVMLVQTFVLRNFFKTSSRVGIKV